MALTSKPPVGTLLRSKSSRIFEVTGHHPNPYQDELIMLSAHFADGLKSRVGYYNWKNPVWFIASSHDIILQSRLPHHVQPPSSDLPTPHRDSPSRTRQ